MQYLVYAGIFILPFIVFFVDASHVFPFITAKNFPFRIIVEIIFGAWLILAFLDKKWRPKKSWLLGSATLFVGIMFIANITGMYPYKSMWSNFERMEGWVTLIHLLAYLLVLGTTLRTKKLWTRFWLTSTIASIGVGLFSLGQLLRAYLVKVKGWTTDQGIVSILPIINQGGDRVDATLGNATYLAEYMMFSSFITIFLFVRHKGATLYWKMFYIATFLLQVFILYKTATRGAILGFIGGMFLIGLLLGLFAEKKSKARNIATALVLGVLIFVGLFFGMKNTSFVRESHTLSRFANISLEDTTTKSRFLMWGVAFEGFKEHPILGYGQENFNYVFNKHYNPDLYEQEQWFDRSHNFFFDWLIAGGTLGLLAYLLILVFLFISIWKLHKHTLVEKTILAGLLSAYIFQNLFVFDQIMSYLLFFALIAYLHSFSKSTPLFEKMFEINKDTRDRIILPVIVVVTCMMLWFVNYDGYMQSRTAIQAMQVTPSASIEELNGKLKVSLEKFEKSLSYDSFGTAEVAERLPDFLVQIASIDGVSQSVVQGTFVLAENALKEQIERKPEDARYYLILGSMYSQFGLADNAIDQIIKARELSPQKPSIILELAQAHLRAGKTKEALETAKEAYDLQRENDDAWRVYALVALINENTNLYSSLVTEALAQKRYARVEHLLKYQKNINPTDIQIRVNLVTLYLQQEKNDQAIQELQSAQTDIPEFADRAEQLIKDIKEGKVLF